MCEFSVLLRARYLELTDMEHAVLVWEGNINLEEVKKILFQPS